MDGQSGIAEPGVGPRVRGQRASIAARLDRLPPSRHVWGLVLLISAGAFFEFYELFVTGYVAPGMAKEGLFSEASLGGFGVLASIGVTGFGTFVFATFAGLFVGSTLFGAVADRYGRRTVFTGSLIWYSVAGLVMATRTTGLEIDLWRFIAGIGLGVELVTVDTYVAEMIPAAERGRAFAANQVVAFLAVPVVALLAWLLVPEAPFGIAGWRWVAALGCLGAAVIWVIRLRVPESPRWLDRVGRHAEADRIATAIEAAVQREQGRPLPAPSAGPPAEVGGATGFGEIWRPPYRRRTLMMSVFQVCQTIGFYGFAAWVPSLLVAKGIHVTQSLYYSFIIAIANPLAPLIGLFVADRIERKWQIVGAATSAAVFGLIFAEQTAAVPLIGLGVLVTLANNWMSFAFHNYQAELFPTRIRARAVGFVYSWSRLSAAFAGLAISALLARGGVVSVFLFIAAAMAVVVVSIGVFGPKSRGLALEEIAQ